MAFCVISHLVYKYMRRRTVVASKVVSKFHVCCTTLTSWFLVHYIQRMPSAYEVALRVSLHLIFLLLHFVAALMDSLLLVLPNGQSDGTAFDEWHKHTFSFSNSTTHMVSILQNTIIFELSISRI